MKLFYITLLIVTLISCDKDKMIKKNPRVSSSGYENGSSSEVSSEDTSTAPIYTVDRSGPSRPNCLVRLALIWD